MSIEKLRNFVVGMTRLVDAHGNAEAAVMAPARAVGRIDRNPEYADHRRPGMIGAVTATATTHDIHVVSNALPDRASISIHLYGGNIGAIRRHVFDPTTGAAKTFMSGYSGNVVPNLWPAPG